MENWTLATASSSLDSVDLNFLKESTALDDANLIFDLIRKVVCPINFPLIVIAVTSCPKSCRIVLPGTTFRQLVRQEEVTYICHTRCLIC